MQFEVPQRSPTSLSREATGFRALVQAVFSAGVEAGPRDSTAWKAMVRPSCDALGRLLRSDFWEVSQEGLTMALVVTSGRSVLVEGK